MNIALIGASGFVGSALLQEALSRGHDVTALVSRPDRLAPAPRLRIEAADALDSARLAQQLRGHDVVISAFSGHAQSDVLGYYLRGLRSILSAVKAAGVPRLLVVGGAGSLEVAPGVQLLDTPEFPAAYKPTAEGARQALHLLRDEPTLDWTMLSPAPMLRPGERTGRYRVGGDQLIPGGHEISVQDYAVAMLDEAQTPAHSRRRFTVAA
jgi:uncharacterized protein